MSKISLLHDLETAQEGMEYYYLLCHSVNKVLPDISHPPTEKDCARLDKAMKKSGLSLCSRYDGYHAQVRYWDGTHGKDGYFYLDIHTWQKNNGIKAIVEFLQTNGSELTLQTPGKIKALAVALNDATSESFDVNGKTYFDLVYQKEQPHYSEVARLTA